MRYEVVVDFNRLENMDKRLGRTEKGNDWK